MSTYGLKYYAEVQNFRKQLTRVEILQRDLPSGTTVLQIGDVCGLVLELQGGQDDVFAPIVKTQARLSMISSDDKPTAGGIKYGGWGEFFTPDDTLYKVVIKTKATPTTANWTTRWSGYITPDSWREGLEYRAAVTITARDNIGHLQDFEFDMQGDTYGLVKISDLITAAMTKVSMPMTLSVSGAPEYLEIADNGRKKLLDAYVVASNFKDKDWYTVLEGVLDSIGYTLRYTDNNRVTLAPMRHLPLTGEDDHQDQPQMAELEFYGGTGEQVPAVKKITDEHSYDYAGEVYLPILGNFSYGQTQTYREFMEGNILPGGGKINKAEHDAFFNKLTNAAGTVWETGSDMFDPSLYRHDERLPEGWDQYVFIPINGIDTDIRVQTLSFLSRTTDLTIRCVFSRRPIDIFGTNDWLTEEANSLYKIRYVVRYEKGNETRYLNNRGEWASSQAELEEEFDAQDDYATELVINLPACTELGDGGRIYLSFDGIWYKHWPGAAVYSYGDYARLASVSVSPNPNNLSKSIVKTVNDEKYNVLMERKPMLSPLSIDAPFSVPENYGSALFYYPTVGSVPKAYPFMMNWCTVSANVEKPLPVFIHQQILCYRGANLWELSGDCAPSGNDAFKFNTLCEYKNRTYILMSGTYDFLRGTIDGAVLREFLEYDDLWDDTEQPSPGEPGSWNSNPSYPGGGTPGSSAAAGGGGGGVNYFEEDGDGGIKLKDEYNGLMIPGFIKSTGDQIVIDGDPGGGGGGGATPYLYELQDVVITNVSTGQMLAWNGTNWVNVNAPAGTITSVVLEQGGSDGTLHLVVNGAAQADVAVKGLDANLTVISGALQSLQSQIDAVASRNNYDELTATALFSDTIASPDAYIDVLHIGSAKIWWDSAKNALRIDKALVTDGDQIVIDGTPGGGGSGGALYLNELLDVTITNPSSGQTLLYQNGVWVNSTVDFSNYYTKSEIDTMASRYVLGTRLDADEGVISDALRSLQAQIDAVASRNNFDELTASAVFSDTVSASAMYAGALTLGGYSFNGADINEAIAKANTAYQKPSTGIPNADIESPWVKVGTTQISLGGQQTSLAGLVNVTMSGKLTIGSAEIEWVPGENGNPGYLKVNSAFVTEGDQIIISGTPGGGGSAAAYLYELDDVSDALSSPATGDVLQYNGTEWVGVSASTIGGVTSVVGLTGNISTTQIADALTAAGYALTDTIVTSLAWSAITGKPTTLSGYGITDAATASEMTTVSAVLQSLQSQIDSVSARNAFDELVSTAIFADTLSASNAYLNRITGDLAGNADTASRLVSASYSAGGTYQPVYFSYGLPVACSYAIYSALYNGTAGRLAYYSGANLVSDYYGSVGSGVNPMYLSSGVPTASSDTAGSASLPVYLNAGTITACTASSMFSALGSNLTNNLEVTIFGQLRYISDLYATYDGEGEVIGDKFTIVSNALRSLQGQIDSVAARQGFDTLNVVNGYFDMISVGGAVGGNLHVIGTFSTTGDQVVTSDATKKTCLRDISLSVEQIAGAPAVTFDWKAGGHSFGSIAQYWKGVLPESVLGPEGDYSLAYGQLALVNSIVLARRETEQDREIKRLKERVALLENKVEQLTIN